MTTMILLVRCRDDDMLSLASMLTADNSYDIGNMADIDKDDYYDNSDPEQPVGIVNSDSSQTVTELTSQIEDAFNHDRLALGK